MFGIWDTVLYTHSYLCIIRVFFTGAYKAGLLQISALEYLDTSNTAALTSPWRSFVFFVVPNCFCHTDAAK